MSESWKEQLSRVHMTAEDDGETWDLSENDKAALKAVLSRVQSAPERTKAGKPLPAALVETQEQQHMENIPEFSEPRFWCEQTIAGWGVFYRDKGGMGRKLGVGCAQNIDKAVARNVCDALNKVVDEETARLVEREVKLFMGFTGVKEEDVQAFVKAIRRIVRPAPAGETAREQIWCDNCEAVRPLVRCFMPADERNDHAATDLLCGDCRFVVATLHHLTAPPPPPDERIAAIDQKLERVKQALRDNELDVLNPQHHASWDDIEYLLSALRAGEPKE